MSTIINISVLSLVSCLSQQALAISAQELQGELDKGEKLTIIDVRNIKAYKNSHIPSAINIPAFILPTKQLPPLGHVIVYGDGIQLEKTNIAVEALNKKRGIQAELLEGGIAAWQSENLPDTGTAGMKVEVQRHISYQKLIEIASENSEVILIDLRRARKGQKLTDINQQIPSLEITQPIYHGSQKKGKYQLQSLISSKNQQVSPLYILVDNGDEMSEKVYRRLQASGVRRVAILAGGELILSRQGRSGQQQRFIKGGESL